MSNNVVYSYNQLTDNILKRGIDFETCVDADSIKIIFRKGNKKVERMFSDVSMEDDFISELIDELEDYELPSDEEAEYLAREVVIEEDN